MSELYDAIREENLPLIKYLLQKNVYDTHTCETAVQIAILIDNLEITKTVYMHAVQYKKSLLIY